MPLEKYSVEIEDVFVSEIPEQTFLPVSSLIKKVKLFSCIETIEIPLLAGLGKTLKAFLSANSVIPEGSFTVVMNVRVSL